jgi:hypothetical protein
MGIVFPGGRLDLRFPDNAVLVPVVVARVTQEAAAARQAA